MDISDQEIKTSSLAVKCTAEIAAGVFWNSFSGKSLGTSTCASLPELQQQITHIHTHDIRLESDSVRKQIFIYFLFIRNVADNNSFQNVLTANKNTGCTFQAYNPKRHGRRGEKGKEGKRENVCSGSRSYHSREI